MLVRMRMTEDRKAWNKVAVHLDPWELHPEIAAKIGQGYMQSPCSLEGWTSIPGAHQPSLFQGDQLLQIVSDTEAGVAYLRRPIDLERLMKRLADKNFTVSPDQWT